LQQSRNAKLGFRTAANFQPTSEFRTRSFLLKFSKRKVQKNIQTSVLKIEWNIDLYCRLPR